MRRACFAVLVAGGVVGFVPPLAAQPAQAPPEGATQEGAAPPAPPTSNKRMVIVVADVDPDETANARLRAVIYETARREDYEPQPRLDVMEAARSADVLEEGRVSVQTPLLERLRKSVDAAAVIRISREWERGATIGVRVTVVTDRGNQSRVVQANADDPSKPVNSTVADLLRAASTGGGHAGGATASQAARSGGWIVTPGHPAVAEENAPVGPGALRKAWDDRGGLRAAYDVRGIITGVLIENVPFSDTNPFTNQTETSTSNQYGIGGGVGLRLSMMYFALPDPAAPTRVFGAFRLGVGVDGVVLYSRPPTGFLYRGDVSTGTTTGRQIERDNRVILLPWVTAQIGVHLGFGSYHTPTLWRGVVVGVAYSPAYILSLDISAGDFKNYGFNYGGAEVTVDFSHLHANADGSSSSEPQIRAFAMLLPRINENMPWIVSAGIGAAWY